MSVVSASYVELVRSRRALHQAFLKRDWEGVRQWDSLLGGNLNRAFDDDHRDTLALVEELEKVLKLYADIVVAVPEHAGACMVSGLASLPSFPAND